MATAATTYIQLDASYTRCTGCVPRKLASEYFGHMVSARRVKLTRGLMFQKCSEKLTNMLNMILSLPAWSPTSGGARRRARRTSGSPSIVASQRRVRVNLAGDHLSLELVRPGCAAAATAAMRMPLPIAAICVIKVPGNASDRRAAITRRAPLRPRTQPRATRPRATQPMWEFPLHRRLRSPLRPRVAVPLTKSPKAIPRLQRRRRRKPRRPATPCSTASRTQS